MLVPPHHARAEWPMDVDAADIKRVGGGGSTTDHLQADVVAMVMNRSSRVRDGLASVRRAAHARTTRMAAGAPRPLLLRSMR